MRPGKVYSRAEVEAVDPQLIDSVTGDRLVRTCLRLMDARRSDHRLINDLTVEKVALWLAGLQGEAGEAAEWITSDVGNWVEQKTILDEWAHDWRLYIAAHESSRRGKRCGICGAPVVTWDGVQAACSDRHWRALKGELPDEQCRLCNEVTVCAFDLDGSPVCADCWPGERLLAERRAAWAKRWDFSPYPGAQP